MTLPTAQWRPLIAEACAYAAPVPEDVLEAMVLVESNGNPQARSVSDARGLTQIIPKWHADVLGVKVAADLEMDLTDEAWFDPRFSLYAGARLLKGNYGACGSWASAVRKYHSGSCEPPVGFVDGGGTSSEQHIQKYLAALIKVQADRKDTVMGFNIGNRPLRIAAFVGHADTSSGNQYELGKNRQVAKALAALAKQSNGFDLRYAPSNLDSVHPGPLDDIVYDYLHNGWMKQGWLPDVVFSNHHEGGAAGARGVFFIYPHSIGLSGRKVNGDYTDIDVRDHAGRMATILGKAVGMGTRYNPPRGMSERETGVGGDGWRLGFFGALSDSHFQENTCVFISECGNYSNAQDKAIMDRADFPHRQAVGLLESIADLAVQRGNWTFAYKVGGAAAPTPKPTPTPAVRTVEFLVPMMIRTTPGFWDTANDKPNVITTLPAGTKGTVISGPVERDGLDWYDVNIPGFGTGFVAKQIINAIQVK